jgi:hypothetical protein
MMKIRKIDKLMATLLALGTIFTTMSSPAGAGQLINSLSQKQEASYGLGVWGVPACVLVNNERPRGIYITAVARRGLAIGLGLEAGDVLLSLNGKVTDSSHTADRILSAMSPGRVKAVIARVAGAKINLLTPTAELDEIALRTLADSGHGDGNAPVLSKSTSAATTATLSGGNAPLLQLSDALESYMLELVNADRAQNGLPALKRSSGLGKLARDYALYILKNDHFAHEDLDGLEPKDRAHRAGLNIIVWENLAWRGADMSYRALVKLCEEGMMGEPPNVPTNHRGCILNEKHQTVGIGIVAVPPHKVICVQEFSPQDVP